MSFRPAFTRHVEIKENKLETSQEVLRSALFSVVRDLLRNNREEDPSDFYHYQCKHSPGFYVGGSTPQVDAQGHGKYEEHVVNEIVSDLLTDGYYVFNRYNKYYVVAFALDYQRFEVYSKDCNKKLIEWREDCDSDPVVRQIADDDYNENPVLAMMAALRG